MPLRIDGRYQVEPKGASRSLVLYEIGAMGEPLALSLPSKGLPLTILKTPLPIRFTVLEENGCGRDGIGNPAGEIYGKVAESVRKGPIGVKIRFASVTPELKTWLRTLSG